MQKILQSGELRPKKLPVFSFLLRHRNLLIEVVAALYIVLFIYTGINKILAFKDLRKVLKEYPLIASISELIAWGVPIAELLIAALLLVPKTKRLGLILSGALMSIFSVYLSYMIIFTPKLPCTCGGMLQELSWTQHIIFNLVFIFMAFVAIRLYPKDRFPNS